MEDTNSLQEATDSILLATQIEQDRSVLESASYAVSTAVVSGLVQLADIPTSIGNMFGDDNELTDIEDVIYDTMGADAAEFYADNKSAVDMGGFIASSFVPGMAGVKALNKAQTAVRTATKGKQLHPFYKTALGVVAPRTEVALDTVKATSAIENTSSLFRADALKAIATNAQQSTLETIAFELAVAGAMSHGEVLDELSAKQLADNMIMGVGIGAGIGGLFSTIKVSGAIRAGIVENAPIWNKYSLEKVPDESLPASTKAAMYFNFLANVPTVAKGSDEFKISKDPELNAQFEATMGTNVKKVADSYKLSAIKELTALTGGDGATATVLFEQFKDMSADAIADSLLGMKGFVPVGVPAKKKNLDSTVTVNYADIVSGNVFITEPKYVSLQDLGKSIKVNKSSVVVGNNTYKVMPSLAHNIEFKSLTPREHEARAVWMSKKKDRFFTSPIFVEDVSALDSVVKRLEANPKALEEIKIRDKDNNITIFNVESEFSAFKEFYAKVKIDLATSTRKNKVLGDTVEDKAEALRQLTGINFVIGKGGISKTMLSRGTLEDNLKKLLRLNLKPSTKVVLKGKLSAPAKLEARRLSKQLLGKTIPNRSDIELLTDAKLMLGVLPEDVRVKYPTLMNEYGSSMHMVSDKLRYKFGFNVDSQTNLSAIARAINLPEDAILTGRVNVSDILHREQRFASIKNNRFKSEFALPYMYKATYDSAIIRTNENELRGVAKLAASSKIYLDESQAVADSIIGAPFNNKLPSNQGEFLTAVLTRIDSIGTSANALTASNRDYGHVGSFTKFIGHAVTRMKENAVKEVQDNLAPAVHKIINDEETALGWSTLNARLRSLPGNYVLDEANGRVILAEVKEYLDGGNKGTPPPALLNKDAVVDIPLTKFVPEHKVEDLASIINLHVISTTTKNKDIAELELVRTGKTSTLINRGDIIYPIPVDRDSKPYFSYVFDSRIATGNKHSHMLYASTASELKKLEQAIKNDPDLGDVVTIRSQDEIADYYKALNEHDLSKAVSSKSFSSELIRKGLDAPYFVETDPAVIANNLVNYHANKARGVVKRAIETKYSNIFAILDKAAKRHSEQERSTASTEFMTKVRNVFGSKDKMTTKAKDPYVTYASEMLGETNIDEYMWWKQINDTIENVFDSVHTAVFSGLKTKEVTDKDLLKINKRLKEAGFQNAFVAPLTAELTNKQVSKNTATKFVATVNSILSFFVLRTDPMNAVNNMVGHNVLYNAELRDLLTLIKKKDPNSGILRLLELDLPSNGNGKVLSHSKIVAQAISDFWTRDSLRQLYKDLGYSLDISQQIKQLLGDAAIDVVENEASISAKLSKIKERINSGALTLEKATLNQFSEEMVNFVSARTAHIITDYAVEAGVMSKKSQHSYINTFVNRVRGTYTASQRPALFQGPLGMSMALFQTYQLNLMQQLFRYASSGRGNSALYMMGLQASIYGANGIPGYSAINTHVIGELEGNPTNQDITGAVYKALGVKGGDWLIYGASANALSILGGDDLATNIYTRGDLNPRQITVVPISPLDAPWFAGWSKFIGNLYDTGAKLVNGADAYSTIARGLEHNGLSRPLSGLGRALQGLVTEDNLAYSTTKSGNLLATYDLISLATVVGLAGGRTLTEARSLDALYRKKAYAMGRTEDMKFLKSVLKTHTANNTSLSAEEYEYFLNKYVAKGGTQKQFRAFLMDAFKDANESSIKAMRSVNDSVYGRDMQAIMGGEFRELYPAGF